MSRILVIDDIAAVRRSVQLGLTREGHTVDTASGLAEAEGMLRATRYNLVLTDILMPERDGLGVIEYLRRHYPDTKVVAMSGGGSLVSTEEALTLARSLADAIIRKPFDRTELMAVLRPHLEEVGS